MKLFNRNYFFYRSFYLGHIFSMHGKKNNSIEENLLSISIQITKENNVIKESLLCKSNVLSEYTEFLENNCNQFFNSYSHQYVSTDNISSIHSQDNIEYIDNDIIAAKKSICENIIINIPYNIKNLCNNHYKSLIVAFFLSSMKEVAGSSENNPQSLPLNELLINPYVSSKYSQGASILILTFSLLAAASYTIYFLRMYKLFKKRNKEIIENKKKTIDNAEKLPDNILQSNKEKERIEQTFRSIQYDSIKGPLWFSLGFLGIVEIIAILNLVFIEFLKY